MSTQMHLNLNLRGVGFHRAGWRHPSATPERITDPAFFTELARIAERGKFDAVFLADSPVVFGHNEPLAMPLEPLSLLGLLAQATERIGLIGTISTTYNDPVQVARKFASLDQISGGRIGMNFVTSAGDAVARNFGHDSHPEPERRYDRAAEFVDVLLGLWGADGGIDHHGRDFDVSGELSLPRSPQGHPVLVQAGASPSGRTMAAARAEAVYTGSSTIPNGIEFYQDVKARTVAAGRSADSIKILPGIVPYIGDTEAEAIELFEELEGLAVDRQDAIDRLSQELDLDLRQYDLDGPVPFDDAPVKPAGTSRTIRLKVWADQENLSIRQLATVLQRSLGVIHWTVAGTGEQVADQLEEWFLAGAADGFNVLVPHHPSGTADFVDKVVPILQERGLFRRDYEGTTLRSHFGLAVPD